MEIKQLSADEVIAATKDITTGFRPVRWHTHQIMVRPLLSFTEIIQFVNSVMESCMDSASGSFVPEALSFAYRLNIIMRYADVQMPDDVEQQYAAVYATDLYDTIYKNICRDQADDIKHVIDLCAGNILRC